jgi:hypothetical protein
LVEAVQTVPYYQPRILVKNYAGRKKQAKTSLLVEGLSLFKRIGWSE